MGRLALSVVVGCVACSAPAPRTLESRKGPVRVVRSCDFTFQQIYFAAGESRIQKHQRWGLDQNASGLLDKACGGYARRLELAGHADATETDAARLALERARVVERYLVSKGVARDRLRVRGYGSRRPVRRGTAPADLATNRRVEFVVLEPAKPPSAK